MQAMTMGNVIEGFQVTGVYPFNPSALLPKIFSSPPGRFHNLGAHEVHSYA